MGRKLRLGTDIYLHLHDSRQGFSDLKARATATSHLLSKSAVSQPASHRGFSRQVSSYTRANTSGDHAAVTRVQMARDALTPHDTDSSVETLKPPLPQHDLGKAAMTSFGGHRRDEGPLRGGEAVHLKGRRWPPVWRQLSNRECAALHVVPLLAMLTCLRSTEHATSTSRTIHSSSTSDSHGATARSP